MAHPEPDELLAFANGRLGAEPRASVEAHLDGCEECGEVVVALAQAFGSGESVADTTDETLPKGRVAAIGGKLERFHILEEVGRGAMGVVFAAYDPDLDRRVALKVLRQAGSDVRFLREAQAMARLSHPNVITVHEARVVDEQLYISMEFVDGPTLREWMAEDRPWREVLRVFAQVARGLAAAHAAGLVHRDIKPDNVLLDREGSRARVTDFGLARPAEVARDDVAPLPPTVDALGTDLTQAGSLVGTPAYMSPEQLRGDTAGAESDQFSFCVALHEGLFGERPFAGTRLAELSENVLADARVEPSSDRGVPRWLRQAVMRGLASKPEERHPSMDALLRVLVRGDRAPQRRRQALLIVGALAIGGASTFAIGALSDPVCSGADERLAGIWDPARKTGVRTALLAVDRPYAEATWSRVQAVLDGYRELWIDGYVDACEATNVRRTQSDSLLDARMRCLERHRGHFSALVDVLDAADDEVLQNASAAADALPPLDACADLELVARDVPLPDDAAARHSVSEVRAELARVRSLETAGKYSDGLEEARRLDAAAGALEYKPLQAETQLRLGALLDRNGKFAAAKKTLERAVWLARASGHDEVVRDASIGLVTAALGAMGTSDIALDWARAAWAELERNPDPRAHAELLLLEANALREASRHAEALPKLEEAVAMRRERLGDGHPQTAIALADLAKVQEALSDYEGSLASNNTALEILRAALGEDHPQVGYALSSLAYTEGEMFHHDKAVGLEQQALAIFERSLEADHPRISKTLSNLGNSLSHAGRWDEAVAALKRSAKLAEKRLGPDHPDVATPLLVLAQAYMQTARNKEALPPALRGQAILEAAEKRGSQTNKGMLSNVYTVLSNIYVSLGRDEEAIAAAQRMLEIDQGVHGDDHEEVAMARINLGTIYGMLKHYEKSREQLETALPILRKKMGADHPYVAFTLSNLASVYRETDQPRKAITAAKEALALKRKRGDMDPRDVANTEYNIGTSYFAAGDVEEAITWLDRGNTSAGQVEGIAPADLGDVRFALAQALQKAGRDKQRARDLALLAREAYKKVERTEAKGAIKEIEQWLARHHPGKPR